MVMAVPLPFSIDVFDGLLWSATHGHSVTTYDTIGATYLPTLVAGKNLNRKDNNLNWSSNPFVQTCDAWTRDLSGTRSALITRTVYNAEVAVSATPIESDITYDCDFEPCLNSEASSNGILLQSFN